MASRSNTIRHSVRHFEKVIGRPITTTPSPTPVFVAVFGTRPGGAQTEVLGGGHLATDRLVLGDADTVAALADGAVPTMVGIAWVASAPRAQARTVKTFGPSAFASPGEPQSWAVELAERTSAPVESLDLPPGAIPASGWCLIFPFLSMCKSH